MINVITLGLATAWFAEISGIAQQIRWYLKEKKWWYKIDQFYMTHERRIKPFDCALCLGFWVGLFYFQDIFSAIMTSLVSLVAAKIYERVLLS